MRTLVSICLAATALVAQSSPVTEPHLAGVLEPLTAAQFLLPVHGFTAAQLAYAPVPYPVLRAGVTTLYAPDPLLCSANYIGAEVAQLVFALPQGAIVLLDASSSLALHVLSVPPLTWSTLAGICIDGEKEQVVLLDAAGPSFLRIDLADLRAGRARFQSTWLPFEWSTVRGIAFDFARDRIVGFDPETGDLLQHSVTDPNTSAGTLSPSPRVLAFGFAPAGGLDHDLFVSSGDPRMLTCQWTWSAAEPDGGETATLRATVATSAWSPASPDPSAIGYDNLRDRLIVSDGEVEEMTIYAGKNVWECSRAGVVSRSTTTLAYSNEPVGITFQNATRTFYISDDGPDFVEVVATGADGLLHTADDTRRQFSVVNFPTDPEDTAFNNATNELWVAGGVFNAVHRLRPGNNGIFDGIPSVGDDQILTVSVTPFGVSDIEGIAVRPADGGIYVIGNPITTLLHLNSSGQLVRTITLPSTGLVKPAGIVFAPSSSGTGDSMYLVDRGIDNEFFPNENDGMLFEYGVPLVGTANQAPVVNAGPDVTVLVTAAAHLAGTATDDGLPGPLTIQWSRLSGPGTATFTAPTQAATDVSFSATGSYTLQLSAFDGALTTTDTCVVTVQQGSGGGTTVERVIATSGDDAEEGATSVNLGSGDIELVVDASVTQTVGLRFQNLTIPAGSTITSAYVQFATDEAGSTPTQLTIAGQASDNAPAFVSTAANISSRPRTTATVAWAPAAWTVVSEAGLNQRTPNLASIVQQITNRPGWSSGNSIAFVITGTGTRTAVAFDSSPAIAAKLVVNHAPGTPVNQPPVVNAGPDVTTLITSPASLAGTVTDDGLPGPLTIQWSKVSGPGTVTFAAPNQAATTATFSASGSYTLQLSASDGALTTTDTCVVTVQASPVNQAPVVNAGPDVTILLSAAATLAGTATDDGQPGPLTIQWSKVSGPGTVTFAAASQAATTATFSAAGSYTLQLSASDGALTSTDTAVVTVQQGSGGGTTVERVIATSGDDAEEGATSVNLGSGDIELVVDGSATQTVGLRFQNLTIPPGAVITSAYVQFTTDETGSTPTQLTIAGQASDNAPAFVSTAANISSRPRTTATVAWAPAAWATVNEAGANQRTPNLASIVQQITNRPGWSSGNSIVFVITGTGTRTAVAFDSSPAVAAKLVVNHAPGTPVNQPPVVNAGPDVTTLITSPASLAGTATDDGQPGPLTIQWSKVSGPGTATFAAASQAATTATFSAAGSYTLQLSASDGALTTTDTCVVTVQQGSGGGATVERVIATSGDDAEEGATSVNLGSGDIELVVDGSATQTVGLRFQNLTIPAGSTITSAYVQFTTDEAGSTPTQLTIAGQASDNAPAFVSTAANISSRPRTTATVAWAPAAWATVNEAGANQRTPNLASIVQQITNRPGWSSGNSIAFVITGTGTRTAVAFDSSPAVAARLVVNHAPGAPVNQPPVVNAGPDVTTLITSPASLAGTVTDDGLPGPLTIQWSKVSGPGTVTFAAPNQAATTVTFSASGSYTLQLSAFDGEFTTTDTVVVTVQQPSGGNTVERAITTSDDDAEESGTSVNRASSDLEMVVDGSVTQTVGLRFQSLTIPAGAVITSAYVQFTTDEAKTAPTQLTIAGQASDNAPTFAGTANNVSSRPRTAATVAWAPVAWTIVHEAGPNQRTPSLASVVQEIVSRPGWSPGNAMVFVITGTGTRTASAFDDGAALAAKLIVTYQ